MKQPRFSICIPTFNRGYMLQECIQSVIDQSFLDYEIIVVDNNSQDNTQEILSDYNDKRMKKFQNTNTISMYENHNICISYSTGEWIIFLHSDDTLMTNSLNAINDYIMNNTEIDLFFPSKPTHGSINRMEVFYGREGLSNIFRWQSGCPSGAAYRAEFIKHHHFLTIDNNMAADYWWIIDLIYNGKRMGLIPNNVINISIGSHQASATWNQDGKFLRDIGVIYKTHLVKDATRDAIRAHIHKWSPLEIARFLKYLAHADLRTFIDECETVIDSSLYKSKYFHYNHVRIYKLLGYSGLQKSVKVYCNFRKLKFYLSQSKLCKLFSKKNSKK